MQSPKISKILLTSSVLLLLVISILQKHALDNDLFWIFWWYDVLLHFLGGAWIAITSIWFFYYSNFSERISFNTKIIHIVVLSFLIIAIGWEIFEVFIGVPTYESNYGTDTIYDLVIGMIGAIFTYKIIDILYISRRLIKNKNVISPKQ